MHTIYNLQLASSTAIPMGLGWHLDRLNSGSSGVGSPGVRSPGVRSPGVGSPGVLSGVRAPFGLPLPPLPPLPPFAAINKKGKC